MKSPIKPILTALSLALPVALSAASQPPKSADKPNIVFILADDAGIGDFSAYGCKYGVTPNIDRLAKEGMKFNRAYSGNAVCAPSRDVLMTGMHPGHGVRRANQSKTHGLVPMPAGQMTVARLLHDAGYVTGGFGKWGLGNPGTTGIPEQQGFDVFFGYYDQVHAHDYYTDYLVRNSVNEPIQQSGNHTWEDYSHTRIANETLKFIEQNKDRPFFCYAAWTPPHMDWVIPDTAPYSQKDWSETDKIYAAMVALIDKDVGRVIQKLKDLGLDEKTLVIFSSDNGAHQNIIKSLGSNGGLRGYKRLLYEGGIRAPFIARWPGRIQPGATSDLLTTFMDFLPTAADLAGVPAPQGIDGISILPTLLGQKQTVSHEFLYFELYEGGFQQSVRMGDWKGYRTGTKAPMELYNLKTDPVEAKNLAAENPDVVKQIDAIMTAEHTPSPYFIAPEQGAPAKAAGKKKAAGEKDKNQKELSLNEMLNEENSAPEQSGQGVVK